MLNVFRRHQTNCPHRGKGRNFKKCSCSIWVDGRIGGIEVHKSLRTSNWEEAQKTVRGWEVAGNHCSVPAPQPITLDLALQAFVADLNARHLHISTIRKYKLLEREMRAFANQRSLLFLKQLDVSTLSQFRTTWRLNPLSSGKKLERLRAFFTFCMERGWVDQNYARKLKAPKVSQRPTLPFEREEMLRILAALDPYI
jgi:integrase/recombinase XerD